MSMVSATNDEQTEATQVKSESDSQILENKYFAEDEQKTSKLPQWLDHFNSADLKTLVKCSVAAWTMTLLLLIEPTLKVIGQATFFGVIVIFIVPPSGVALVGLMGGATLVVGICLAWAWGSITMKAALATRPAADLQRQYQALQEAASRNTSNVLQASGQATFQQVAIFEGFMLDTRVTVTYFCMLGVFIYLLARIRVAAPKLALLSVFGIVVADIYLTIAPLIPTFTGTLPRTLAVPATVGMGVSLACNLLLFPKSTSHMVLNEMDKLLQPMNTFLEAFALHLEFPARKMNLTGLKELEAGLISQHSALDQNLKFLALDVSFCRWSTGDLSALQGAFRQVLVSFYGLVHVQVGRLEFQLKDEELLKRAEKSRGKNEHDEVSGGYQLARTFDLRGELRSKQDSKIRDAVLKHFGRSSRDLLNACQEGLTCVTESIRDCDRQRWFPRVSESQRDVRLERWSNALQNLREQEGNYSARVSSSLHTTYSTANTSNKSENVKTTRFQKADGLVYVFVMEERVLSYAGAVRNLLAAVVKLGEERQKSRLWLPGSLKNAIPLALEPDKEEMALGTGKNQGQTPSSNARRGTKNRRDKAEKSEGTSVSMSRAAITKSRGARQRTRASQVTLGVVKWFSSAEGLYALRVLTVSMTLGLLAVNRTTAGFFYREKGLWGLIMSQTALLPYTADFVYSLGLRTIGTIVGAVIGLVAWYIGAGNGPGNPYGMAAIMAPVIVVLMWLRLFASPALLQGIIITAATLYLVVAYSWVDTHIPSYGNPGVGYSVFWRRTLLVMIGFAAAAFVTLFPRPPSANRHYRRVLSNAISVVKEQYILLVDCKRNHHSPSDVQGVAEKTAIELSGILLPIESQVKLTKFELSSSNIDAKTLGLVCHLCMNLNQSITQLTIHASALPESTKHRFFHTSGAVQERLIADIMAILTLVQHALKNGDSLPAILPGPLMESTLTDMQARMQQMNVSIDMIDQQMLADSNTRHYFSAVAAYVQFLGSVDEILLVVKGAVGETLYVDLEA